MAERIESEDSRRDDLYRKTLLAGCQAALRDNRFVWWLDVHRLEIAAALAVARSADPVLLAALNQRFEVRLALRTAAEAAWAAATTHPDPDAVDITVEWAGWGERPEMTFLFSRWVRETITAEVPMADRAACYLVLVDRLRPVFSVDGDPDARRGGWVDLLRNAGWAVLRAHQPDVAVGLLDEAWLLRGLLPTGTIETASTVAALAQQYASAVCYASQGTLPHDAFQTALDRIGTARAVVAAYPDSAAALAQTRLHLALAESQVWYVRRCRKQVGYLTEAEHRLAILIAAEDDLWRTIGKPGSMPDRDLTAVPAGLRLSYSKVLVEIADTALVTGDTRLAARAGAEALALSESPIHHLDTRLTLARMPAAIDDRLRQHAALLRELEAGALDQLSDHQRGRIERRLRHINDELVGLLFRADKPTAAWFWNRQGKAWRDQGDQRKVHMGRLVADPAPAPRKEDYPAAGPDAVPSWLDRVLAFIAMENVVGIVHNLRNAGGLDVPLPDLLRGLAAVDAWFPPGRRRDPGRLAVQLEASASDAVRAALELAAEFVDSYADYLGAQIYQQLATMPALPWERRRVFAERAVRSADHAGRLGSAVSARETLLELAFECDDQTMITDCVLDIIAVMQATLTSGRGAADLIDLAKEVIRRSSRMAGRLSAAGRPQLAYQLASAATGVISRMSEADPDFVIELELVEQWANGRSEEAAEQLFQLMRRRVLADLDVAASNAGVRDSPAVVPPDTCIVQLLHAHGHGSWALGLTSSAEARQYWAVPLELGPTDLTDLRRTVWHQLQPRRGNRPAPALGTMHSALVAPLERHIGQSGIAIFVLHHDFAGLPLHAALGPSGHLIERRRVGYLASPDQLAPAEPPQADALVAGWDPTIGAGAEATELSERLDRLGFAVNRPAKAVLGKKALLDPAGNWGVLHVAAHGDFHPWPASMTSQLRLTTKVSLSAGDWLRSACRAAFVFLNTCNVGRHAPHAGDLNGFPLAMRARGAVATVSALSPVPSAEAREFARHFYRHWPSTDSLSAFRAACLEMIVAGRGVSRWAPYLHTGVPMPLHERSSAE